MYNQLNPIKILVIKISESMYLTCAENSDCTEAFSECRVTEDLKPKKCGCLLGFSYFPDQHACIEAGIVLPLGHDVGSS